MNRHFSRLPLLVAGFAALATITAVSLHAADGTWTFAGNGSWDMGSNWSGGTIATGANATATFQYGLPNSINSTITVDTDRTIGNLSFIGDATNGTHNITLSGTKALTLSTGTGTAPVITVNMGSRTVTINTVLAGTEGVTLTDTTGGFVLGGANTYSGLTTITFGSITVNNNLAFGDTNGDTTIGTASNSAIILNNGIKVSGETLHARGTGTSAGGVLITAANAVAEWAGNIQLDAGVSRFGANGTTAILTLSGIISDGVTAGNPSAGSLAITQTGTVVLSGANTYTGTTQVVRGTMKLDVGNNRLPTGTALDIWGAASGDNAVLNLNGFNQTVASLTRNIVVSGATSTLTNTSSTQSSFTVNGTTSTTYAGDITGNIALVKAGTSTLTLSGANTFTGGISVQAGTLSINSAFINDTANVSLVTGSVFDLNFSGTDTIGALLFDGVSQAIGTYGSISSTAAYKSSFFTGAGILNVTSLAAIPEPSAIAALAGGLTLGLCALRRRRSVC